MKKKIVLIILLSAICLVVFLCVFLDTGKKLSDHIVSEDEATSIMASRAEDESLLPELYFGNQELTVDTAAGQYYYSLISGDDNAYDPYVKAGIGSKRINVALVSNESSSQDLITPQMIQEAKELELLFYNEKNYVKRKLICTTIPIMSIVCDQEIGDIDPSSAFLKLFDNGVDAAKRSFSSDTEIRLRGGSTRAYPKLAYKLSLVEEDSGNHKKQKKASLLGMRSDDDWVLYAAYNDQEKIRNVFSSNLWAMSCGNDNSYGVNSSPEYRYLELFMNGTYYGLYALGYTPDERDLGLNDEAGDGFYKKKESLNLETYDVKNKGAEEGTAKYAELKRKIYEYYFDLQDNCFDTDYLKSGIDLDNAMDFYLFICLIQGKDNLHKNYYTILKQTDEGHRAIYIPWDMDMAWGNVWVDMTENNSTAMYKYLPEESYLFVDGYMYWLLFDGDEEAYNTLFERYDTLREGAWSNENIMALLDKYEEEIFFSGAYIRDKNRWPLGNYIEGEYSLSTFKTYVENRLSQMDAYIERLKNERTEDPFVTQTLLYGDFEVSDLVIRFDNRQELEDDAYRKLLEKCNIDVSAVSEDAGFILYRASDAQQQVVSYDSDLETGVDTILGRLWKGRSDEHIYDDEDDYSLFVDDIDCMKVKTDSLPLSVVVIPPSKRAMEMKLEKTYKAHFNFAELTDRDLCIDALPYISGNAVVMLKDVKDSDTAFLEKFDTDLGGYLSLSEAVENEGELVVLLNSDKRMAALINNATISGTVQETELGTYAYFENEGNFGMYINGEEILTGLVEDSNGQMADIMLFSEDWTENTLQKSFGLTEDLGDN
ncbi:MAG: hypothetical protein E7305_11030 [Butyrivibrio sp.]|nr:hypothetical protein [Butyrivibrio sp.]